MQQNKKKRKDGSGVDFLIKLWVRRKEKGKEKGEVLGIFFKKFLLKMILFVLYYYY